MSAGTVAALPQEDVRESPAAARPGPPARAELRAPGGWRLDLTGTAVALTFFALSLTPSLLPRSWFWQGLISGILSATGYLSGVAAAALARRLVPWRPFPRGRAAAWRALAVAAVLLVPLALYQGAAWQREIHSLMGLPAPSAESYLRVLPLALAVFVGLVATARALRRCARAFGRLLGRWVPAAVARVAGALGVLALVLALLQGVVANGLMSAANASFSSLNGETVEGVTAPADGARSGGPGSLVPWSSLGREGQSFVAGGPGHAELERFNGRPALRPVRVYVGLESAPTLREAAALAVRELERTDAFSRRVLLVIATTGTGWVDRHSIDPLEYLHNGDTAMVALQYSYLPSVLSFLADRDRARVAGRELFNQVHARWAQLPAERRPKLLVFGESLGVTGAESAFSGLADITHRTDGMLLVGPPNNSPLWREFVAARDPGTPEVLPTYQRGGMVHFAGRPADLDGVDSPWVVYLQHASDPVVWWSPRLILHRPDWLAEPRGRDVLPAMRWYPFVTFWQLTADLVVSAGAPAGHGHDYSGEAIDAWVRLAPPPGWSAERAAALHATVTDPG